MLYLLSSLLNHLVVAGMKKEGQGYRAILSFQLVLIFVLSAGAKPLKGKTK